MPISLTYEIARPNSADTFGEETEAIASKIGLSRLYEIKMSKQNELSADINVITAEINAYQRVAGEAIFEIGRRLKHVKENDLAHGEFGKWLDEVGINDRMARKFMTVAREFEGKRTTSSEIGLEALYQIATLPPEHRESEQSAEWNRIDSR